MRAQCSTVMVSDTTVASVCTRRRQTDLPQCGAVLSTCAVRFDVFCESVECEGDNTWKETPAGQYAYIDCPGAHEGYIGRYCTHDGEWGLIKDLCYLPEGMNAEDYEMEVEL